MTALVFGFSMFLSAVLMFLLEPMISKMMLPLLGGTPAVWNTCLVFFQAVLLAGYIYAHASSRWLKRRPQVALHILVTSTVILIPGLLPIRLAPGWTPPASGTPVGWILALLTVSVGLPFFVLSANAPILQRWFADAESTRSSDPYFLYAASNAGSLCGLLAYPVLIEPLFGLSLQGRLWRWGFLLFAACVTTCAVVVWTGMKEDAGAHIEAKKPLTIPDLGWAQRLRWIALAFVPSSLILGVTTALTTDMPAIPLLWVLPLALYLLSFILVFARRQFVSLGFLAQRLPFLILAALIPEMSQTRFPLVVFLAINLALLWTVAMVCHGELARTRPPVSRLTEFYLWLSIGGVLGGIFNALVAPLIFRSVLEFPLVLIFAALLRPMPAPKAQTPQAERRAKIKDWLFPVALGLTMLLVISMLAHLGVQPGRSLTILIFGYSAVWCLSFGPRRLRFALGIVAMLLASARYIGPFGRVLVTDRSFFGVLRVSDDLSHRFHYLIHGATIHGIEAVEPLHSREPLAYYSQGSPIAQILQTDEARHLRQAWAVVGLGSGAMACYAQPGESLSYYEIDPLVPKIARDPRYFSYLSQCAPGASIELGDARLRLRDAQANQFGLIVLDAFSGDSIPMHLLTREALKLYLGKLRPGGTIAFHISNRYIDLTPVLANLAQDAHLLVYLADDSSVTEAQMAAGVMPSRWVVMARSPQDIESLINDHTTRFRWMPVHAQPGNAVWTDDYSNLLRVIRWH